MKLTTLFLLTGIGAAYAGNGYAQSTLFTMNLKEKTVKEVFEAIEKDSEYVIFYYDKAVDTRRRVTIHVERQTVDKILDKLFEGTNNAYAINDRQILVSVKPVVLEQGPARKRVTGRVIDENNAPLPGVTLRVEGTTRGVSTDVDGSFVIDVTPEERLLISFVGYQAQTVPVGEQTWITVQLKPKTDELEEVTVVAFAKQRKESVIGSITTISPSNLRVPSSNLTTAFAGQLAGLISYQRSGEPGEDNASFFIRGITSFGSGKVDPLILIDGMEMNVTALSHLNPDDIANFSIMKDATATALYGARGANGVILVTTREGREGKSRVSARFENSFSMPTRNIELADPITYMKLHNEAVLTRNPLGELPYSSEKIARTGAGENPYVYPATNWYDMLFKKVTSNQRVNINLSGGGSVARYYVAGSFAQDNGVLKVDKRNNFNSNIDLKKYTLHTNVNINLSASTELVTRLHAAFDDYRGPLDGGADLYNKVIKTNPVLFPAYYAPDEANLTTEHILFGNAGGGDYLNPYADLVKGYKEYSRSSILAQLELKQNFNFVTEGLNARFMLSTTRDSYFELKRAYTPFWYRVSAYDRETGAYKLFRINPDAGRPWLSYDEGDKLASSTLYMEGVLQYDRVAHDKHAFSGLLVLTAREALDGNAGTLTNSLPHRNLGVSGRFTYAYDGRYFTEFNFGYNGSERFAKNERWGFFPSAGVAWYLSNEKFWPWKETFNKVKLRATYGMVGNDQIGSSDDRFFYLSKVNLEDDSRSYNFGYDINSYDGYRQGVTISRYADEKITWETAYKQNYGLEVGVLGDLDLQLDYFREHRTRILQYRSYVPNTMGLQAYPQANIGETQASGLELSLDYSHVFDNHAWVTFRGTFTYATAKYKVFEEPSYEGAPWRSRIGAKISQQWGLIAERLFVDEEDVRNSPEQLFGPYKAGDIKYKDINYDGIINAADGVQVGFPTTPEINYGFGFSYGRGGWDLSAFFQGSARSSFWIDPDATAPFVGNRALLRVYADDHWSEEDRNLYALWPRLSNEVVANNTQLNTWFMRNGAFLRLKSAEIGYTLPDRLSKRMFLEKARIYLSGTNLLSLSKFKLWDVEMAGNGLGYPLQRVYNLGLNVNF
ncbi:MAG: TonB-dependent receptor [Odoribacteraceae bacterium]|jgi:TonB-linked SusC/RagA family outer membrane protein|nr:TonB-dependent receptor [Odoribacteraceae bacterium]